MVSASEGRAHWVRIVIGAIVLTPFGELPNNLAVDMSMAEQHEWFQRPVSRRSILIASGVLGGGLLAPSLWSQPARATTALVYGRNVAYGRDPRVSMQVGFA